MYSMDRIINDETVRYDCLDYYVFDDVINYNDLSAYAHQNIPYCISTLDWSEDEDNMEINGQLFLFADLVRANIAIKDLMAWSVSIDIVERFEMYLAVNNTEQWSSEVFYNCSEPFFGTYCQYSFTSSFDSFSDYVEFSFSMHSEDNSPMKSLTDNTCYQHLTCNRSAQSFCLDWREICDGKIDCYNWEDEKDCSELEMNECHDNEYRCRNGQCIPEEFLWDNQINPDCLDRTDIFNPIYWKKCFKDPSFRCEEHTCRGFQDNVCGDGSCEENYIGCGSNRDVMFLSAMLSLVEHTHLSFKCWEAMICAIRSESIVKNLYVPTIFCQKILITSPTIIEEACPLLFFFPKHNAVLGHVRLVYTRERNNDNKKMRTPKFICYNRELCDFISPTIEINGSYCNPYEDFNLGSIIDNWSDMINAIKNVFRPCSTDSKRKPLTTTLFQCPNSSKVISKHRLVDSHWDCANGSDEFFNASCFLQDKHRFRCGTSNKCISPTNIRDLKYDCDTGDDEQVWATGKTGKIFSFQILCDGVADNLIGQDNETDETNCNQWPCDNQYTHCDGIWNCWNGADDARCGSTVCPEDTHPCIDPFTYSLTCLPVSRANDHIDDCLGGADERVFCRTVHPGDNRFRYRCWNASQDDEKVCISTNDLCDQKIDCKSNEDERFCSNNTIRYLCDNERNVKYNVIGDALCNISDMGISEFVYFSLSDPLKPKIQIADSFPMVESRSVVPRSLSEFFFCHRGLIIVVVGSNEPRCLCPPAFYGSRCEFQNQRVSLTLQFRKESSSTWYTIYQLVVFLLENDRDIHSWTELTYIPSHDCRFKFNIYLLYKKRPKHETRNYSIRINAFNGHDLSDHVSWRLVPQFQFLPVLRISTYLFIPNQRSAYGSKTCSLGCGPHGQCTRYVNQDHVMFCQCDGGWIGDRCDIKYLCDCAPKSRCVGWDNGRSICICPLKKFGPRCYISHTSCQNDTCQHDGICIPTVHRGYLCICTDGFSGLHCEKIDPRIDIEFSHEIDIPQSILVHIITVYNDSNPMRTTVFKKVPFDQTSVSLSTSNPINIAFIEFSGSYFLVMVRKIAPLSSTNVSVLMTPNHRCASVRQLLHPSILQYSPLRRAKFYHIACQTDVSLMCIYDTSFMCLCNNHRHANCFEFDHNMTYNCLGSTYCENGARCFQDDPVCAKSSLCVCAECFYGRRCQFSNRGFGVSLDGILGYHIRPNTRISKQPMVVQMCIILTTIMLVIGLINGFLSTLTFYTRESYSMGCEIYLLVVSFNSLITISLFTYKFWVLILSQMGLIVDRNFLWFHCVSTDFLLRISNIFGNWINASVAVERSFMVTKGINFDKVKSVRTARWIIFIVFFLVSLTVLQDPLNRQLIEDVEDQRLWCIIKYSPFLQIITSVINLIHFFIPFICNFMSALIIIIHSARYRFRVQNQLKYWQYLFQQLQQCKHLLISSCLLVIFSLPGMIISLVSNCMRSTRNPWLYLRGYLVSFLPSLHTTIIFIVPSTVYKERLFQKTKRFKTIFIH
ncbi:unnamed protein product [Rotaria magnacalcarata]|uniref:Uncharacterized protein n=1 Tax=Rotaria magnacalcarata TaxID=392030 RepID=A0A816UGQ1_9BILA|nr:unnamed protein product [Rotaria magnacalcarata]